MKKIIFIFLFSFLLHNVYSQTYQITYHEKKNYTESRDLEKYSLDLRSKVKEIFDNLVNVYHLENKDGQSKFYFDYALVKGEVDRDPRRFANRRVYVKNFSENYFVAVTSDEKMEDAEREAFDTGWEIDAKRDTMIAGFNCKRAVLHEKNDSKIIAWFTSAIPIMDGPFRYAGLPGLILHLKTKKSVIQIHDIQIIEKKGVDNQAGRKNRPEKRE